MSPVEWYFAQGTKQIGPVSAAELKRLAASGELRPQDLVWREGLTEWAPARSVRGLFDEGSPTADQSPSLPVVDLSQAVVAPPRSLRHPMDSLLGILRAAWPIERIHTFADGFQTVGLYGLLASMLLVIVFFGIVAAHGDAAANFLIGTAMVVLLAALQFAARKFCGAIERLQRSTFAQLPSNDVPDGLAILSLAVGVFVLLVLLTAAMQTGQWIWTLFGVAGLVVYVYAAAVAASPASLGISIVESDAPASREMIQVATFLLKKKMRIVPVVMGAGVLVGLLLLGIACWTAAQGHATALTTANLALITLLASAALPVIAYGLFLLALLVVAIWRAVLTLSNNDEPPATP
ncbi:MAG: DUF4339 domain-containing protein [Planctomycetaceae bacterium]|nr:DUF4339 domain-containing protein [Planctomycetaceae bacterium]